MRTFALSLPTRCRTRMSAPSSRTLLISSGGWLICRRSAATTNRRNKAGLSADQLPHAIAADRQVGVALAAALHQISGRDPATIHADDRAARHIRDHVVGDQRGARAG